MSERILYAELRESRQDLAHKLDAIRAAALTIWSEQLAREFTAHGEPHIEQVERNLDRLTRPLQTQGDALTCHETFVLLAACYLHDIGTQLDVPDARKEHAQYAYGLILTGEVSVGGATRKVSVPIADADARESVALVARGHWVDYALDLPTEDYVFENHKGRLRLLGLLLAMADLLDLSPVRARYFRSEHRTYGIPAESELHQGMHALVKGCSVAVPDARVPGELQFELIWRDRSEDVQAIEQWALHGLQAHWRRIAPALATESGGVVRWAGSWVTSEQRAPAGDVDGLTPRARDVLRAKRAEQLRMDRDAFAEDFQAALRGTECAYFALAAGSEADGDIMCVWCEAQARSREGVLVAHVDVQPGRPTDLAGIISELLEQSRLALDDDSLHLAQCGQGEALERLRSFVAGLGQAIVAVVVTDRYEAALVTPILEALLQVPPSPAARVCLLLCPQAEMPDAVAGVTARRLESSQIPQLEVEAHIRNGWGFGEDEARATYAVMGEMGFTAKPVMMYNYLKLHCGPPIRAGLA